MLFNSASVFLLLIFLRMYIFHSCYHYLVNKDVYKVALTYNGAGRARSPMPAWSGATVSFRLHPVRRRLQPPPSPVVVILAAGDPTYTAVHCRRSCISGGWKPALPPNVRLLSSNADCFPEYIKAYTFNISFPS